MNDLEKVAEASESEEDEECNQNKFKKSKFSSKKGVTTRKTAVKKIDTDKPSKSLELITIK